MRNDFAWRDATVVALLGRQFVARFLALAQVKFARGLQDWTSVEESNGES